MRYRLLIIVMVSVVTLFGCGKGGANAIGSGDRPKPSGQRDTGGAHSALGAVFEVGLVYSNALESRDWDSIYEILNDAYKDGVSKELFTLDLISKDIDSYYVIFHKTLVRENAGYSVVEFRSVKYLDRRFMDVLFYSKTDDEWVIDNLPIPGHPELNFIRTPSLFHHGIYNKAIRRGQD